MTYRALNDDGLAEEAVQETFLRAWRAADRYDPQRSSLRTWMFAIARNVTIDLARARSARPERTGSEVEHKQEAKDTTEESLRSWEMEEALRHVLATTTALVVAHRPSTVLLADRVALLSGGRITAVGTHTELLDTVPAYRQILSAEADFDDDLELPVGASR